MLRGVFRTKEGKLVLAFLGLLIIIIGIFAFMKHSDNKRLLEQAVMAENYLKAGNYEEAAEAYIKALSMKHSDQQLLSIGLADSYAGMKKYDKALEVLRSCYQKTSSKEIKEKIEEISAKKTDYEFFGAISRAEVYFSNKEYDKAIAEFEKAKLIKSKEVLSYKRIAEAYIEMGNYALAREEVLEGQEITQGDALNQTMELVDSFLMKEKYTELITEASEYIYQENYEDGILKYQEAIKLLPNEMEAYEGLAQVYMAQEKYDKAVRLLETAIQLVKNDELVELLNQATQLKEEEDEKNSILTSLYQALNQKNIEEVITIMDMKTFQEDIVQEEDFIYYPKEIGENTQSLIIYDSREIYYGDCVDGGRTGKGIYFMRTSKSKSQEYYYYDGEWNNNIPNGSGETCEALEYQSGEEAKIAITITKGNYRSAYENGTMTKHFYEDGKETGWVKYSAKNGVPQPLTNENEESLPTPEAENYIIGALYLNDQPTGEYFSVAPQTEWGVKTFIDTDNDN